MPATIGFPALDAAEREVYARKLEKARWMKAQVAGGRSKGAVGRDVGITRQAVHQWLQWLEREEAA